MIRPYETGRSANVSDDDLAAVRSHDDVARIVDQMADDLQAHPDEWDNATLERFLDALARSLTGLDGLYQNRGETLPSEPSWKLVAEVLVMASGYE
jgi:hypothetical protein